MIPFFTQQSGEDPPIFNKIPIKTLPLSCYFFIMIFMNKNQNQPSSSLPPLSLFFITDKGQQKLAIQPENSGVVFIDFSSGKKAHRRLFGGGKNQPLAKAVGLSSKNIPLVLDATAGMGADSFVLASLGCSVILIERSEKIAALLKDALRRGLLDEEIASIISKMTLVHADATDYLLNQRPAEATAVEVVYLDPMYPKTNKKSAPKKDMKLLQTLVGADKDSAKLLTVALKVASKRVVVKRPKNAPYINNLKPHAEIHSPNTRYDIYSIKALQNN